jgi:hypothetical protein
MSRLTSGHHGLLSRSEGHGWGRRSALARHARSLGPHPGWVLAGVAAVGLGLQAVYYIGPDVKRYMKLRNM